MNLLNFQPKIVRLAGALVVAGSVFFAACGGSSSSTETAGIGGTGIGVGGTGISFGTVTDFGSIIVNGRRIDTSTASVTLDDNPGSGPNGGIKLGMVVKAFGTLSGNTGTATSVEYRDNLEGEVCSTVTLQGITTLRVLGQTVIQDATTIVENGPVLVGKIVEVSGLQNENEEIQASFIEVKNPVPTEVEVKGRVDSVDNATKMLTINSLDVDFNLAIIDNNIPGGEPMVGQFVEVTGLATDFSCGGGGNDMLIANKVELEEEGAGAISDGVQAEIEGFITELTVSGFKIGEQEVVTTGSTSFLPEDFGPANLVVGAKVEAEGTSVNGKLTATKISFRRNVKLESDVDTVIGNTFTLVGLPGIVITTNSETTGDPAVGHIRVRGIEGPGNTVLATRIDDKTGDTEAFLQGAVDTKVGATITILGIPVDTNSISEFEGSDEGMISRQEFLDLVQPGTLVKVEGDLIGMAIVFSEAELED
jgi:hypothetical protein